MGQDFIKQYDFIYKKLDQLAELYGKNYNQTYGPVLQDKPITEKPEKKEEKIETVAELIKRYGSIDIAIENVKYWKMIEILDKDPDLSYFRKREIQEMSREKWNKEFKL